MEMAVSLPSRRRTGNLSTVRMMHAGRGRADSNTGDHRRASPQPMRGMWMTVPSSIRLASLDRHRASAS